MQREPYQTKAGVTQYRPLISEAEYHQARNEYVGFCLACGNEPDCVEPDARRYKCESCGQMKVYGLEELLMMGLLKLAEFPSTDDRFARVADTSREVR